MSGLEGAFGTGDLAEGWRHRQAIVRCMRYLQGPAVEAGLVNEAERQHVDEALNPPLALIAGAGAVYAASFLGLRKGWAGFRTRPLVLQLAACAPAGVFVCLGGLARCHGLLQGLAQGRGGGPGEAQAQSPLVRELAPRCGEVFRAAPGARAA